MANVLGKVFNPTPEQWNTIVMKKLGINITGVTGIEKLPYLDPLSFTDDELIKRKAISRIPFEDTNGTLMGNCYKCLTMLEVDTICGACRRDEKGKGVFMCYRPPSRSSEEYWMPEANEYYWNPAMISCGLCARDELQAKPSGKMDIFPSESDMGRNGHAEHLSLNKKGHRLRIWGALKRVPDCEIHLRDAAQYIDHVYDTICKWGVAPTKQEQRKLDKGHDLMYRAVLLELWFNDDMMKEAMASVTPVKKFAVFMDDYKDDDEQSFTKEQWVEEGNDPMMMFLENERLGAEIEAAKAAIALQECVGQKNDSNESNNDSSESNKRMRLK